ncbi:MAG TPA: phytanoyl-CoA dioxygenase family protein [Bryobacteraceae bacterium]|jgi:ectoine hydroxylase-related dioxygenase (phytanoyl-CoA dioxygenase family)
MTTAERTQLDRDGYTVIGSLLDDQTLQEVRERVEELYEIEGENAGSEFRKEPGARRLANLVDKGEIFQRLIAMPRVLELVRHILGPKFKLSSFNSRSANPHSNEAQPLHCDAGALPDAEGFWVCNTIWLLDDFTSENGATRVIPGSQNWGKFPQDTLADPAQRHPDEVLLLAPAGSVVVMNTHAWHGGTANRSGHPRRALHAFYCRSDKPQQQYQKRLLRPETQARLSPELRALLALDDPLNDKLSSAETNASGFLK